MMSFQQRNNIPITKTIMKKVAKNVEPANHFCAGCVELVEDSTVQDMVRSVMHGYAGEVLSHPGFVRKQRLSVEPMEVSSVDSL